MPRTPAIRPSLPLKLYELAVTNGQALARFMLGLHAGSPRLLAEDFSGTAALARAWVRLDRSHRAVATDLDRATLHHIPSTPRLTVRCADVLTVSDRARPPDIIAATNFPIGYWHTRKDLLAYLRRCRGRLAKGGILVADLYGGPAALTPSRRSKRLAWGGKVVHYTWHQRAADPLTGRVRNSIHFRVTALGRPPLVLKDAFAYDWRLWSIPELRDAMHEAGFRTTEVHDRLGAAIDHLGNVHTRPVDPGELEADYVVYVVGRA